MTNTEQNHSMQEVSPADIAAEIKRLSSVWLQAVQNVQSDPKSLLDEPVMISVDELHQVLKNRPLDLLEKALEKIDSNLSKSRSLYRSQLFVENECRNSDLGCADGSDIELVQHIIDEQKELKAIISKVIAQLKTK